MVCAMTSSHFGLSYAVVASWVRRRQMIGEALSPTNVDGLTCDSIIPPLVTPIVSFESATFGSVDTVVALW